MEKAAVLEQLAGRFPHLRRFAASSPPFHPAPFVALLQEAGFSGACRVQEPMARHTGIKIGGPADLLVCPKSEADLRLLLEKAVAGRVPIHIHGSGYNTLVRDGGIRGVVLSLKEMPVEIRPGKRSDDSLALEVDAGVSLQSLVQFARKEGLAGLAPLAGIPASVGGALAMNAGVPGCAISDHLCAVRVMKADGTAIVLPKAKLDLAYRKTHLPTGAVILSAQFAFPFALADAVSTEIQTALSARREKQPLEWPSLGSVFMNPTLADLPSGSRRGKLPTAGMLIDEAGLKGVRVGAVRISDKHANFIINEGGGCAEDVEILMRLAKEKVKALSGVGLRPEIKVIGEGTEGVEAA